MTNSRWRWLAAAAAWLSSPNVALVPRLPMMERRLPSSRRAVKLDEETPRQKKQQLQQQVVALYRSFRAGDARASLRVYNALKAEEGNRKLPGTCYDGLLISLARLGEARACRAILRDMANVGVERSEASYSALVQAHVNDGDLDAAKGVLEEMSDDGGVEPRLRTFAPLLKGLCGDGRVLECRALWRKMLLEHSIEPTQDLFADIIVALVQAIFQAEVEDPMPKNQTLLTAYYLDELRAVLREMEMYLEGLDGDVMVAIEQGIKTAGVTYQGTRVSADWVDKLEPKTALRSATIEPCPVTGITRLQSPGLDLSERRRFRDRLVDVSKATSKRQGDELEHFGRWLDEHPWKFTAVVDGPNVAYFHQNFPGGGFNVKQVAIVVQALEDMGFVPLVVMPAKYTETVVPNHSRQGPNKAKQTSFHLPPGIARHHNNLRDSLMMNATANSTVDDLDDPDDLLETSDIMDEATNRTFAATKAFAPPSAPTGFSRPQRYSKERPRLQTLTEDDIATLRNWSDRGSLYAVPRGCHDDPYWMLATVTGKAPVVVTNDRIRDHWHKLVGARAYRRWVNTTMVNFNLVTERNETSGDDVVDDDDDAPLVAKLDFPPPLLRMIHRTLLRTSADGSATTAWHIPDITPGSTRWLCIQIRSDRDHAKSSSKDNEWEHLKDPAAVAAAAATWVDRYASSGKKS